MPDIKCPNCGAMIDPHEPKCPYCGYINPAGAQEKFMNELEEKRLKLDNVDEEAAELYNTEIKKKGRRLAITVAVTAAVIILGVLAFALRDRFFGYSYERSAEDEIEEIAWQKENFPKLTALYEAGEYDDLVDLYFKLEDTGYHDFWDWEHYSFLDCLTRFSSLTEMMENYPRYVKEKNDSAIASIIYQTARFYYRDYENDAKLSKSDLSFIEGLREYAVDVIRDRLRFSDDDMEDLRKELYGDGYVDFRACEKVSKRYIDQFVR